MRSVHYEVGNYFKALNVSGKYHSKILRPLEITKMAQSLSLK